MMTENISKQFTNEYWIDGSQRIVVPEKELAYLRSEGDTRAEIAPRIDSRQGWYGFLARNQRP